MKRTDFATASPNILRIFEEFYDTGLCERVFAERRHALSLRFQLYRYRMMMQNMVLEDELAARLFRAVMHMYLEISQPSPGSWCLTCKVAPLAALDHPDNPTPWKEQS